MKQTMVLCAVVWFGMGTVSSVMAYPTIQLEEGLYQSASGGEFKGTVLSGDIPGNPVGSTWQTFCVELDEYVSLPSTYYAVVNTAAVLGGVGGPEPDPLSPMTAWLYDQFCKGTLPGYDYSTVSGRKNSAAALQDAIWHIEEEITRLPSGLATDFYNQANASGWTDIGDIRVLNLYGDPSLGAPAQDVLISTCVVPAPGALLLAGMGTALVGAVRRRFSRA